MNQISSLDAIRLGLLPDSNFPKDDGRSYVYKRNNGHVYTYRNGYEQHICCDDGYISKIPVLKKGVFPKHRPDKNHIFLFIWDDITYVYQWDGGYVPLNEYVSPDSGFVKSHIFAADSYSPSDVRVIEGNFLFSTIKSKIEVSIKSKRIVRKTSDLPVCKEDNELLPVEIEADYDIITYPAWMSHTVEKGKHVFTPKERFDTYGAAPIVFQQSSSSKIITIPCYYLGDISESGNASFTEYKGDIVGTGSYTLSPNKNQMYKANLGASIVLREDYEPIKNMFGTLYMTFVNTSQDEITIDIELNEHTTSIQGERFRLDPLSSIQIRVHSYNEQRVIVADEEVSTYVRDFKTEFDKSITKLAKDIENKIEKFKGYFQDESSLKRAYPTQLNQAGFVAWVGEPRPGYVYRVDVDHGEWVKTNTEIPIPPLNLNDYLKIEDGVSKETIFNASQEIDKYNFEDRYEPRYAVPESKRTFGMILVYKTATGGWRVEQFIGSDINKWGTDKYWKQVGAELSNELGNSEELGISQALFTREIKKKVDNAYVKNKHLQLTSYGLDVGEPIKLGSSGIINLTYDNNKIYDNPDIARAEVLLDDRFSGQLISYNAKDNGWVIELFKGEDIKDWSNEDNWNQISFNSDIKKLIEEFDLISETISNKGDGLLIDEDNNLYLTSNGEQVGNGVKLPEGGGGGETGIIMRLRAPEGTTVVTSENNAAIIKWDFSSVDKESGVPTGDGSVEISVNGVVVHAGMISQGINQHDVRSYVTMGRNNVVVAVTDSYGTKRSIRYTVQKVSLRLTSYFNISEIQTSQPVPFRYMVTGSGTKTVQFWLNDVELEPDTVTTSGVQTTKSLNGSITGINKLKVKATSIIDSVLVTSNELYIEYIYATGELTQPIIISSYNQETVKQFETIRIPFFAYDPLNEVANVSVYIDGIAYETLQAQRVETIWEHRVINKDKITIKLQCGSAYKEFKMVVTESEEGIVEIINDLAFRVKAIGKSNGSVQREEWKHNGFSTTFRDFNWVENGWLKDNKGNVGLKLTGNANASVDIRPFNGNVLNQGMTLTLEYSTENIADDTVVIMEQFIDGIGIKITPTNIAINSAETGLSIPTDSSKRISISFVIQKRNEQRLLELYINGILSRAIQYSESDRFNQGNIDLKLSTGGNKATLFVYAIRWYRNNLQDSQILSNYIYDMEDSTQQNYLYTRNNIINEYGEIDYNKVLNFIPCMKIIGALPMSKKDKLVTDIIFEHRQKTNASFRALRVLNTVQGTSSQFYPRKNYKFQFSYKIKGDPNKHQAEVILTDTGESIEFYPLEDGHIAADVFCLKADFAESSGTHNTGLAILVEYILDNANILNPHQKDDARVRTTIYGYPILVFHQNTISDDPTFIGKYNFNYDKNAENVFGFEEGDESWEFSDNTSNICLFKKDTDWTGTYVNDDGETVPNWTNHIEGRFPKDNMDISNVKPVFDWVASCIGNPDKFKTEAANWFDLNNLFSYWVITEVYGCIDQRAKNQFLTYYHKDGKWRFIFYDNDTILGIDNIGTIKFPYDIETEDIIDSGHVWNGWDSELWILVKAAFYPQLVDMYGRLRSGLMNLEKSIDVFDKHISSQWAEIIYNKDGYFKYVEPLLIDGSNYLTDLQGSREFHRYWWMSNRFRVTDSRFKAGNYMNDFVSLRVYTPTQWQGVEPNARFNLTTNTPGYVHVRFGQTDSAQVRPTPNILFTIPAPPNMQFNDTETIVYGASAIKDLGDLSDKYLGLVDVGKATRLERLIIGSMQTNYSNTNFKSMSLGNNKLLKELNVANCPNFGKIEAGSTSSSLDMSKMFMLEKINAHNTSLKSITFPESGVLKEVRLPKTITNLVVRNQTSLKVFLMDGDDNVQLLNIENSPMVDGYSIAKKITDKAVNALSIVRLVNIDTQDATANVLNKLAKLQGIDNTGNIVQNAYVSGKIVIGSISQSNLDSLRVSFPNLSIEYGSLVDVIEFEDPLVQKIVIDNFDTNGDGVISSSELVGKSFKSPIFANQAIKTFNEAHYFTGAGSEISDVQDLTSMSLLSGNICVWNAPLLRTVYIHDNNEATSDVPALANLDRFPLGNCYAIDTFHVSGRYKGNKGNTAIVANYASPNNVACNYFIAPLRGVSNLYLDGDVWLNMRNIKYPGGTANWYADLREITIERLTNAYIDPSYGYKLVVEDISKSVGSRLDRRESFRDTIIKSKSGKYIEDMFFYIVYGNGAGATLTVEDSVVCDFAPGSKLTFTGSRNERCFDKIDLGKNYKPELINIDRELCVPLTTIIRADAVLNIRTVSPANYRTSVVFVRDELVDEYRSDVNWLKYAHDNPNNIKPLSIL